MGVPWGTPKSSSLIGVSTINHPFEGTPFDGKPPYGIKWHWLYHVKTSSAHPHHAGALPAVLVTLCFLPMKDGVALEQTFWNKLGHVDMGPAFNQTLDPKIYTQERFTIGFTTSPQTNWMVSVPSMMKKSLCGF